MGSIIDARDTAQDHACRGSWQHAGANAGGHEIFRCDGTEPHTMISRHVDPGHVCAPGCGLAFTMAEAHAAMAKVGDELEANADAIGRIMSEQSRPEYDATGNVPSDQCETPASDYWRWPETEAGPPAVDRGDLGAPPTGWDQAAYLARTYAEASARNLAANRLAEAGEHAGHDAPLPGCVPCRQAEAGR